MRTSRSKSDNIKNFNSLCEKDKALIEEYKNSVAQDNCSWSDIRGSILNTLADYLVHETDIPLYKWDTDTCELFLKHYGWAQRYRSRARIVLHCIMSLAGADLDLSKINLNDNLIETTQFILSFSNLLQIINDANKKDFICREYPDIPNKNATTITAIYLAWIGVPASEVTRIKDCDINFVTKTVRAGEKYYSFANCKEIEKHFLQYISSDKYAYTKNSCLCIRSYLKTDLFIKQTKPGTLYPETIAGKIKKFCGQTYEAFLISGRLDRLYHYEQNGGVISQDNYSLISEVIGLSSNYYDETIGNIIGKYQLYKEKRENYTLKR